MLKFENIQDIVNHIFENIDGDNPVSVVSNVTLAVTIMRKLPAIDNDIVLTYANVDTYDYDKEYMVSLHDYTDADFWSASIEPIYDYEKNIYYATDGYILFHRDVDRKALTDMRKNENVHLTGYDWFTIGEESDDCDLETSNDTSESESTYISRSKDGTPIGFQKTWVTNENGGDCYSSYSHYNSDVNMLREIAEEFGVKL